MLKRLIGLLRSRWYRLAASSSLPPKQPCWTAVSTSAVWDQLGDVVVQLGQCLVECGEPGLTCSRELCQVGVGYLAVADDSLGRHAGVWDVVSPEFVPRVGGGAAEDRAAAAADWPSRMSSRIRLP